MTPGAVSLVVLAFNTRELVLQYLGHWYDDALRQGWQVIVVDNGSSDGTGEAVRCRYPGVEVLRSEANRGYAGGNNLGLARVRGDVTILLNTDVIASFGALAALAERLLGEPDLGAVSAGLIAPDGEPQAFAFGDEPRPGYLLRRGLRALSRRGAMHRWDMSDPDDVDWVSGACLALRTAAIREVGGLDERFFLYFEDVDLCLRLRRAGWRVSYDPRVRVVHLGGGSRPGRLGSDHYYRSLETFYRLHYGPLWGWLVRALLKGYTALRRLEARRSATREGTPP